MSTGIGSGIMELLQFCWQLLMLFVGSGLMALAAWRVRNCASLWISWAFMTSAFLSFVAHIPSLLVQPIVQRAFSAGLSLHKLAPLFSVTYVVGTLAWLLFLAAVLSLVNALRQSRKEIDGLRLVQTR